MHKLRAKIFAFFFWGGGKRKPKALHEIIYFQKIHFKFLLLSPFSFSNGSPGRAVALFCILMYVIVLKSNDYVSLLKFLEILLIYLFIKIITIIINTLVCCNCNMKKNVNFEYNCKKIKIF